MKTNDEFEIDLTTPMPIGKHKGRPIVEVLADKNYVEWFVSQSFAEEKYPAIFNFFMGGGAQPSETPEHNALQAQFLDREVWERIFRNPPPSLVEQIHKDCKTENVSEFEEMDYRSYFEVSGWDVAGNLRFTSQAWEEPLNVSVMVEIKPLIGDDYPSVLRQMKINRQRMGRWDLKILYTKSINARGATEDQITRIFNASGFHVFNDRMAV